VLSVPQTSSNAKKQCIKDITFRLNCMMSWDLFVYIKEKYKNDQSVYSTGHVLDPALEVSAIFGRQLLEFLKIKKKENKLIEYTGRKIDDITIDFLYSAAFPIQDILVQKNESDLVQLIKVADKATAHFTLTHTTDNEFISMQNARFVIYELILNYIPDLNKDEIRWEKRDEYPDAIMQW